MKKLILASAAIALALVAAPTAAFAVTPYAGALSSNTVAPGGTVTYTATTGQPEGTVADITGTPDVTFLQASSTTRTVAAGGQLSFGVKVPETAAAGTKFTIGVTAGSFTDSQTVTVVAITASASSLATTGVDSAPYLWIGGGALAVGLALVLAVGVTRRSRKLSHEQA